MTDFDETFKFLLEWEGTAYEKDPDDPGGATKFGIDQRSHPGVNIASLTEAEARDIYQAEWNRDLMPYLKHPFNIVIFNFCVNTGEGRAVKFAQQALGLSVDGVLGPITKAAILAADPVLLSRMVIEKANQFYEVLGERMPKFLKGWLNRDSDLEKLV